MKPLDLSNIEAVEDNERERVEAGGYVINIIDVDDHEDREFLWLVFDIAEGERKDFYTRNSWYKDKPNKHGILLSYKAFMSDRAKGMLKGRLKLFTDSNPGFDAEAAWNAGKPELFIGKQIGIAAGMEEYIAEDREGNWYKGESIDWFHARLKKPEDIRAGKFKVPELRELDDEDKAKLAQVTASASTPSEPYDDIPFI